MSVESEFYVLGLDVSTTCVGWCLMRLDKKDVRYGKFIPRADANWYQRMDHMYKAMDLVITQVPICAIAVEELNSMRGGETTRQLAGANMGVRFWLWKNFGLETNPIHTTTIKKVFAGFGGAKKPDMIAAANKHFGLNLVWPERLVDQKDKTKCDEDVADAIGVAFTFLEQSGKYLVEALNKPVAVEDGVDIG